MKTSLKVLGWMAGIIVMAIWLLSWVLVPLAGATDPHPIEDIRDIPRNTLMFRKDHLVRPTAPGDTLYPAGTIIDSSSIYNATKYVGIAPFVTSSGTVNLRVRLIAGYATSTKKWMAVIDSLPDITSAGVAVPYQFSIPTCSHFAVTVEGLVGNDNSTTVVVPLMRDDVSPTTRLGR